MNKKILLMILLCFGFLYIFGCSTKTSLDKTNVSSESGQDNMLTENNNNSTEKIYTDQTNQSAIKEKEAIAEEKEATTNNTFLSIAPIELKERLLKENNFLKDKTDSVNSESYIHINNESGNITIYLGSATDEKIYTVSYRIENNTPLENNELKKELLMTLKTVLESLNEDYKEQVLIDYINSAKVRTITPELEYSDQLIIYCTQEEDYFTIEIKANS